MQLALSPADAARLFFAHLPLVREELAGNGPAQRHGHSGAALCHRCLITQCFVKSHKMILPLLVQPLQRRQVGRVVPNER